MQCQLNTGLIVSARMFSFKTKGIMVFTRKGYISVLRAKMFICVMSSSL